MKIKNLLISLGLVLSVGAGIGTALAVKDNVKEAKATASTSFVAGSVLYIDDTNSNWDESNYKIGIWNHAKVGGKSTGTNVVNVAEYDDVTGYYKVTITVETDCFNLVRHSSLTEGSESWPYPTNQSNDVYVTTGKNLIIGEGYENDKMKSYWGVYDNSFTPTGDISSATIYLREPNSNCDYYVYSYENFETEVDDFTVITQVANDGAWVDGAPGTHLTPTSGVVYNPANLSDKASYNILKATFHYRNINNVGVIIYAQKRNESFNFQTKNLVIGASADNELELNVGGYYYGAQDWNLWNDFGYDSTYYAEMGEDAAVAYDLATMDICHLTNGQADSLRDRMDGNNGYLSDATWTSAVTGTVTFAQAYSWVDSRCTTPGAGSLSRGVYGLNTITSSSNSTIIIVVVSSIVVFAIAGYFFLRKRKEDR